MDLKEPTIFLEPLILCDHKDFIDVGSYLYTLGKLRSWVGELGPSIHKCLVYPSTPEPKQPSLDAFPVPQSFGHRSWPSQWLVFNLLMLWGRQSYEDQRRVRGKEDMEIWK